MSIKKIACLSLVATVCSLLAYETRQRTSHHTRRFRSTVVDRQPEQDYSSNGRNLKKFLDDL